MHSHSYTLSSAVIVAVKFLMVAAIPAITEATQWCISRSGASSTSLQTALDYACGTAVADCLPIQPSGLCFLPNTLPAHASYAFNSFYQRSGAVPGACDFAGTATISITDPSYGSCTYPASRSTAGGTTPTTNLPTSPGFGDTGGGNNGSIGPIGGGMTPGLGSSLPDSDNSGEASTSLHLLLSTCCCLLLSLI